MTKATNGGAISQKTQYFNHHWNVKQNQFQIEWNGGKLIEADI